MISLKLHRMIAGMLFELFFKIIVFYHNKFLHTIISFKILCRTLYQKLVLIYIKGPIIISPRNKYMPSSSKEDIRYEVHFEQLSVYRQPSFTEKDSYLTDPTPNMAR